MPGMASSGANHMHVETDVLIIGSGGAGMYAAIEAARAGSTVLLADRSLIGRGGATVMAQMTVAVALGEQTPDHWTHHLHDTIEAGAFQCGYCTPGFLLMTTQLLERHPDPDDDQIRHYLSGNLCRCAAYPEIIQAVKIAARKRKGAAA